MKNQLSQILGQLISKKEITISELARSTGILQPVVYRIVMGETDNPRIDTLLPIAKYFGVSMEQLIGEVPLPTEVLSNKSEAIYPAHLIRLKSWKQLDEPSFATDSEFIETHLNVSEQAFVLTVKDSTMTPLFTEKNWMIVEPTLPPQNKDFVIVQIPGQPEPTLRQVFFDGNDIYLKPLNSDFKTVQLDTHLPPHFIGVVVQANILFKTELSILKENMQ